MRMKFIVFNFDVFVLFVCGNPFFFLTNFMCHSSCFSTSIRFNLKDCGYFFFVSNNIYMYKYLTWWLLSKEKEDCTLIPMVVGIIKWILALKVICGEYSLPHEFYSFFKYCWFVLLAHGWMRRLLFRYSCKHVKREQYERYYYCLIA